MSELATISARLKTQDNRITQNPMFCVQENRRLVGLDAAYSEKRCWHDSANDFTVYDDDKDFNAVEWAAKKLEGNYDEFGYIDQWFTVMVAFTEEGCKEYLRLNGHNLKSPRIYVESFNRCLEMVTIRNHLMSTNGREMSCWVAEINGNRNLRTCRGTASACWAALCGEQQGDPQELTVRGWRVIRFSMKPEETDLRFERT